VCSEEETELLVFDSGGFRKIHKHKNYEMDHLRRKCDLYRSAGVVRVVKCRRLRWAGYVASVDIA